MGKINTPHRVISKGGKIAVKFDAVVWVKARTGLSAVRRAHELLTEAICAMPDLEATESGTRLATEDEA